MKKLLVFLMAVSLAGGCMMNRSQKKGIDPTKSSDLAAERKLAEKLPIVTPESVNSRNALTKVREMDDELNRDERRTAGARQSDDSRR